MSSISEAFKQLDVSDDFDKVWRVLYEYLTLKQFNDVKAFKSCLVALINMDAYSKAYTLIKEHLPQQFVDDLVLEVAYVYYKLDKFDQLAKLPRPSDVVASRGFDHIVAQAAYRQGRYDVARDIYTTIASDSRQYDNAADLAVNQLAVVSQTLLDGGDVVGATATAARVNELAGDELRQNYDYLFNQALIELAQNRPRRALAILATASELCQRSGDDDVTPIVVAQGYAHQYLGNNEAAVDFYDLGDASDDLFKFIIENNKVLALAEPKYTNVNLVARELDFRGHLRKLDSKLTHLQRHTITKLDVVSGYVSGTVHTKVGGHGGDATGDVLDMLNKAGITYRDLNTAPRALARKVAKIAAGAEVGSRLQTAAALLLTHIGASHLNYDQVVEVLEKVVSGQVDVDVVVPAVLAVLLAVYEAQASTKAHHKLWRLVDRVLNQYVDGKLERIPVDTLVSVALKALTESKLVATQDLARAVFSKLADIYPNDTVVQAVVTLLALGLSLVEQLTEGTGDIDELLAAPLNTILPPPVKKTITKVALAKVTKPSKKKAAKFGDKKVLVAALEYEADEERWLPMKMRLYYKPTKKDRKKMGGGHQGAMEKGGKKKK